MEWILVALTCSVVTTGEGGDHPPRVILPFRLLTSSASNSEPQLVQLDLDRGSPQSFRNPRSRSPK